MSSSVRALIALLLAVQAGASGAAETPVAGTPAAGGVGLLEAMESGAVGVVGRVAGVERLDAHSYTARIEIETILGASDGSIDEKEPLPIAWEELSTGRPPRFANGDRVLACLAPLGTASIWSRRIPAQATRARTAGIAMDGGAFLRDPGLGSVDVLHHYLSLAPTDRETATGAGYLIALAESARLPLAVSAVARLAEIDALDGKLTPRTAASLSRALAREDLPGDVGTRWAPVLSSAAGPTLGLALREAVQQEPASPRLFEALARVGELSAEDVALLGDHPKPEYRVVLARTTSEPAALRRFVRQDPSADVRRAALVRLFALEGAEALSDALAALADSDAKVRAAAARGAGDLGAQAVPGLESVAYGTFEACAGSAEAPRSAISALGRAGAPGRKALAKIARDHPDDSLRRLASIALGELDPHVH